MIQFLFECALYLPEIVLRYPGNLVLRLFGHNVDLDELSVVAYAVGTVVFLVFVCLVYLVILLVRRSPRTTSMHPHHD